MNTILLAGALVIASSLSGMQKTDLMVLNQIDEQHSKTITRNQLIFDALLEAVQTMQNKDILLPDATDRAHKLIDAATDIAGLKQLYTFIDALLAIAAAHADVQSINLLLTAGAVTDYKYDYDEPLMQSNNSCCTLAARSDDTDHQHEPLLRGHTAIELAHMRGHTALAIALARMLAQADNDNSISCIPDIPEAHSVVDQLSENTSRLAPGTCARWGASALQLALAQTRDPEARGDSSDRSATDRSSENSDLPGSQILRFDFLDSESESPDSNRSYESDRNESPSDTESYQSSHESDSNESSSDTESYQSDDSQSSCDA
jgi:hypothetical protein